MGISKKVNPTMLRHARIMHLMNKFNRARMRYFFLDELILQKCLSSIHCPTPDVDEIILRLNGIEKKDYFFFLFCEKLKTSYYWNPGLIIVFSHNVRKETLISKNY